jgi:hypothetical protein
MVKNIVVNTPAASEAQSPNMAIRMVSPRMENCCSHYREPHAAEIVRSSRVLTADIKYRRREARAHTRMDPHNHAAYTQESRSTSVHDALHADDRTDGVL